jgi:3-demethoxyubiquinol 3-hydroxylase
VHGIRGTILALTLVKLQAMPSTNTQHSTEPFHGLTVMFDGACPLCRKEIAVYRSLTPLTPVKWLDVSDPHLNLTQDERSRYMARFHVRQKDGALLSGAAAFVSLWLSMPGWHWLGRLGKLPGVTPVLEQLYRGFLRVRPSMQRWMRSF